jgi:hypothetical protein
MTRCTAKNSSLSDWRIDGLDSHSRVGSVALAAAGTAQTPFMPVFIEHEACGRSHGMMLCSESPDIHTVLGVETELQPAHDGARACEVRGGPASDVRYHDVVFLSTGDGLGYNLVHRRSLDVGVSIAYDLRRQERPDYR